MENTIMDDVRASIEKNLPAQMGEVLRKRLAQADNDAKTVIRLEEDVRLLNKTVDKLQKQIVSKEDLERRERELAKGLAELETRERNIKITLLENQVLEANKRSEIIQDLTRTVFKNPTLVTCEHTSQSRNYPGKDQWGNHTTIYESDNKTVTKTTDIQ